MFLSGLSSALIFSANSPFIETTNCIVPWLYGQNIRVRRNNQQNLLFKVYIDKKYPIKVKSIVYLICIALGFYIIALLLLLIEVKWPRRGANRVVNNNWKIISVKRSYKVNVTT